MFKMVCDLCLGLILSLILFPAFAVGQPNLAGTIQFGSSDSDAPYGVEVDSLGNIYTSGLVREALPNQTWLGNFDCFIAKHGPDGSLVWSRQFGTEFGDGVFGMSMVSDGLILAGQVRGSLNGQTHFGGNDIFVVKYDFDGNVLWTRQYGTAQSDRGGDVATDANGNIFVCGTTSGDLEGNSNLGGSDGFISKLDADGNLLWTKLYGNGNNDDFYSLSVSGNGEIVACGGSIGDLYGNAGFGGRDAMMLLTDANGNLQWSRLIGTSNADLAFGTAFSSDGHVFVSGWVGGELPGNQGSGGSDVLLAKFDILGNLIFANQYGAVADFPSSGSRGVFPTSGGGVYLWGEVNGPFLGADYVGEDDALLMELDKNGAVVWARTIGTTGDDLVYDAWTDGQGRFVLAGITRDAFPGQVNQGALDVFIATLVDSALPPTSIVVERGVLVSGSSDELRFSDNQDLVVRRNSAQLNGVVRVQFKSESPVDLPNSFEFTLEAAGFFRTAITQQIEFFDYDEGVWVQVDSRNASRFSDSVTVVEGIGDLSRFVEDETRCIAARVSFIPSNRRQAFQFGLDQVFWTID